ncbi:MAG: hypothetical protein AAGA56_29180 [Myxococcota bacterium]
MRPTFRTRSFAAAGLLGLIAAGPLACTDDRAHQSLSSDITDIAHTSVKDQSIGNCWIYATMSWVESLHLTETGDELNLSESYIGYFHWFEQIAGGGDGQPQLGTLDEEDGVKELGTGGWWASAVELMRRYGNMDEGAFIPEEANEARSARQKTARDAINLSLKEGVLSDPANRAKPEVVRDELNKAWGLNQDVIDAIDAAFGPGVDRTLYDGPPPEGSPIRTNESILVGHTESGDPLNLADAVGEPRFSFWGGPPSRSGPFAWRVSNYPTSSSGRRNLQIEVQKAMHRSLPVVMTWFVDFAALENDNTFRAPPQDPGRQGGHLVTLEDYEVENVPGFGTLEAGVLVEDPEKLTAALSPDASIKFFRIKNSWGTSVSPEPGQGDELKGYYDLWMDYLNADLQKKDSEGRQRALWRFVLPPSTFFSGGREEAPSCGHDLCSTGAALTPECDPCAAEIIDADPYCGSTSWDDLCVGQVASVCGQTCEE